MPIYKENILKFIFIFLQIEEGAKIFLSLLFYFLRKKNMISFEKEKEVKQIEEIIFLKIGRQEMCQHLTTLP